MDPLAESLRNVEDHKMSAMKKISHHVIQKSKKSNRKVAATIDKYREGSKRFRSLLIDRAKGSLQRATAKLKFSIEDYQNRSRSERMQALRLRLLRAEADDLIRDHSHPKRIASTDGYCRCYVDMCADLFHAGHVNFLRQVYRKAASLDKKRVPYVIVGLCSDSDIADYKRQTILNIVERQEIVSACRFVDEVIPNVPLVLSGKFLDEHQIDFVFHGSDYDPEQLAYYYRVPLSRKIMQTVPYTEGISTSDIIRRIRDRKDLDGPKKQPKKLSVEGEGADDDRKDDMIDVHATLRESGLLSESEEVEEA